jgi:glutamate-1-semialdehyde 2,1-aminomutase
MAAGLATLKLLDDHAYAALERASARLENGLREVCASLTIPASVQRVGSMLTLFFSATPVVNMDDAAQADHSRFSRFFNGMLRRGVHLPPSGYEAWFLSLSHTDEIVDRTLQLAREALSD